MVKRTLHSFYTSIKRKNKLTFASIGKQLNKSSAFIYMCIAGQRRILVNEIDAWAEAMKLSEDEKKEFTELVKASKVKIVIPTKGLAPDQVLSLIALAEKIDSDKKDEIISKISEIVK